MMVNISDIPKILADAAPKQNNTTQMTTESAPENIQNCSIKMETESVEIKSENDSHNDHTAMNGGTEPVERTSVKEEEDSSKTVTNSCLEKESEVLPILKITLKDGKQIVSKVVNTETKPKEKMSSKDKSNTSSSKSKSKERRSSSSSDSKSKSSSKHTSRSSSSSRHKSGHRSPSRHSSDKSKDKSRHSDSSNSKSDNIKKSNDSSSSSNDRSSKHKNDTKNSSKENRSKGKDKDEKTEKSNKDDSAKTLQSIKSSQPSIHKLGKIPKLSDSKKDKPSISIEVRKPDDPKPKTVKTFNSKFRKHGLEEEIKPPPSRAALLSKKVVPPAPPTVVLPKRPSPVHNDTPPEKKPKTVELSDKPGSIKLIPAKPKRKYYFNNFLISILIHLIFSGNAIHMANVLLRSLYGKSKYLTSSKAHLYEKRLCK